MKGNECNKAHIMLVACQCSDVIFPNRWIDRRGAIEWSVGSPDVTLLDFFLWGHLETISYVKKQKT